MCLQCMFYNVPGLSVSGAPRVQARRPGHERFTMRVYNTPAAARTCCAPEQYCVVKCY